MQEDYHTLLNVLNKKIRQAIQSGTHTTQYPQPVLFILLADLFNYQVTQGGFAQLIYNTKGAYLKEIEGMLLAANATTAHTYYIQAIEKCLEKEAEYQKFLDSPYTDANNLKNLLHLISVDYFKTGKPFLEECQSFIYNSEDAVNKWLHNGAN